MHGSTRDEGSIGRKRETWNGETAVDVGQQRTAGGANDAVQMPVGPNGAVLLQHYAPAEDNGENRARSTTGRDIDAILYDALCCSLQSCLDLYGFWRSTGESLDGGGENGSSKPPTGGVLAQSPCQANPGSVRDEEELKQRSVGDEGTLCQLER
ncbi:hypothetical protein FGADI_7635 [Fusarium gaditjirri]|uniref:Uncharacterized protein n=1 Tax=Fusarium gaditjirri TaxID=282569 RepID=A0A8H4WV77_9HYPO|nr:hypothetical protein FGADI_7635 [Fusarium gaditjirri]